MRCLIYLVTEDWYFMSHRLPMAQAARDGGFAVHVATRVGRHGDAIRALGFHLHPLDWTRGSLNPWRFWRAVAQVRRLYARLKPDLVHHVALQPSVIGSLAALGLPIATLNAVNGLGFSFSARSLKARAVRLGLSVFMRLLFGGRHATVLLQNAADRDRLLAMGIPAERLALIPGSGVDVEVFEPLAEPEGEITTAFVGRLLAYKGVGVAVAAQALLHAQRRGVRLLIAGERDAANPDAIAPSVLDEWSRRPGVDLLGHVDDVREVWKRAHIALLPSRSEGLPKSLLEAAAVGRPIVATEIPGCAPIARNEVNALTVPVDDPAALASAIARLADDAALRRRLGAAGRRLAVEEFSSATIGRETLALYDGLLARWPRARHDVPS